MMKINKKLNYYCNALLIKVFIIFSLVFQPVRSKAESSIFNTSPFYLQAVSFGLPIVAFAISETSLAPDNPPLEIIPKIDRHFDFNISDTLYNIGDNTPSAAMALTFLAYAISSKGDSRRKAYVFLEAEALLSGVTRAFKTYVGRDRPDSSNKASFPSGHTSSMFTWASFVATDFYRQSRSGFFRAASLILPYSLATFVGASRIGGQSHFYTDVVAGALIGTAIGYGYYNFHFDENGDFQSRSKRSNLTVVPEINIQRKYVSLRVALRF